MTGRSSTGARTTRGSSPSSSDGAADRPEGMASVTMGTEPVSAGASAGLSAESCSGAGAVPAGPSTRVMASMSFGLPPGDGRSVHVATPIAR